ncbi:hypothetical protein HDU89_006728 [Geranomyces variabilis]|nr:hypothetical protein HDU89_006728 [Geranomyces variabilis]
MERPEPAELDSVLPTELEAAPTDPQPTPPSVFPAEPLYPQQRLFPQLYPPWRGNEVPADRALPNDPTAHTEDISGPQITQLLPTAMLAPYPLEPEPEAPFLSARSKYFSSAQQHPLSFPATGVGFDELSLQLHPVAPGSYLPFRRDSADSSYGSMRPGFFLQMTPTDPAAWSVTSGHGALHPATSETATSESPQRMSSSGFQPVFSSPSAPRRREMLMQSPPITGPSYHHTFGQQAQLPVVGGVAMSGTPHDHSADDFRGLSSPTSRFVNPTSIQPHEEPEELFSELSSLVNLLSPPRGPPRSFFSSTPDPEIEAELDVLMSSSPIPGCLDLPPAEASVLDFLDERSMEQYHCDSPTRHATAPQHSTWQADAAEMQVDDSAYDGRLSFRRLIELVHEYLSDTTNECTVIITQSAAAQKSYGDEKRFFTTPVCRLLGGGWGVREIGSVPKTRQEGSSQTQLQVSLSTAERVTSSTAPGSSDSHSDNSSLPESVASPAIGTLDDHGGLQGSVNLVSERVDLLSSTTSVRDLPGACRPRRVALAVFSKLHIPDDEKRKTLPLFYKITAPIGEMLFKSKPFTKISKPSRKKLIMKSELLIRSGSTLTLFNRTKAQTGNTRYLGVCEQQGIVVPCTPDPDGLSAWDNWFVFCANDPAFDPHVARARSSMAAAESVPLVPVKDGQRQSKLVWMRPEASRVLQARHDNVGGSHYVTPPTTPGRKYAQARSKAAKGDTKGVENEAVRTQDDDEPMLIHYGDKVVLQHCATGLVVKPLIMRKIENRTHAVLQEEVQAEGRGDPVLPLHKLAFQLAEHPGNYVALRLQSALSLRPGFRRSSRLTSKPVKREMLPHAPVSSESEYEASSATKNGKRGRPTRKASALKKGKLPVTDNVGEICIWTLVATDHVETTFCLPLLTQSDREALSLPSSTISVPHPLLPNIRAVPTIFAMTRETANKHIFSGENFTAGLWLFLGQRPAYLTECLCQTALLVDIGTDETARRAAKGVPKVVPILLARDDGVVFRTGWYWSWESWCEKGEEKSEEEKEVDEDRAAGEALLALAGVATTTTQVADVDTVARDFAVIPCAGMVICPDPFRALQVDSNGVLGNSAERINEISKPLAMAGVSILYLSTYQTDYVFVKERRMPLVISTLQASDFAFLDVESFDFDHTPPPTPSLPYTPRTAAQSSHMYSAASTARPHFSDSTSSSPKHHTGAGTQQPDDTHLRNGRFLARKLVPQYTVRLVGLNREYVDQWILTVMRVILFEDTMRRRGAGRGVGGARMGSATHLPSSSSPPQSNSQPPQGRFFNYTADEEGISLVADAEVLAQFPEHCLNSSLSRRPLKCIQVDLADYGLDRYGIVCSMADPLAAAEIDLLYLSTYTTANVLVDEEDLPKAMGILDEVVANEKRKEEEEKAAELEVKHAEAGPLSSSDIAGVEDVMVDGEP